MHGLNLAPLVWWFGFLGIYFVIFVMLELPPLKDRPLFQYFLVLGTYSFVTLALYVKFNYDFLIIAVSFLMWFAITGFKLGARWYMNYQIRKRRC